MKIGIYSPYLDTYGGGERYILTVAECLAKTHQVDILFDAHLFSLDPLKILKKISERLKIDLSGVNYVKAPFGGNSLFILRFIKRLIFLKNYDLIFFITDGSIFYSSAKNNIIHFQVPFENPSAKNLWRKIKLSTWKKAIYNSSFTKEIVERTWSLKGEVIYPPVDIDAFKSLPKKKVILSVGRFFDFLHSKKQEVLVKAFKQLMEEGLKDWKLQLAGGTNESGKAYLKRIKKIGKGCPIEYYPDVSFSKLQKLYGEASIYWHAAGFGEKNPQKLEHFGITTVEAMSAGAVPVVINSGGQKEIVIEGKNGYLWTSIPELKLKTEKLIKNQSLREQVSKEAELSSRAFSKEVFCNKINLIVNGNS